jgi:hypothetical protein
MPVKLEDLKDGDVLSFWGDGTDANGHPALSFARVVKIGAKKVKVVGEGDSREIWKYPWVFSEKMSDKYVAELRADGVKI